jgi:hypothetical protein
MNATVSADGGTYHSIEKTVTFVISHLPNSESSWSQAYLAQQLLSGRHVRSFRVVGHVISFELLPHGMRLRFGAVGEPPASPFTMASALRRRF